ncbi:uncharacterized protein [Triticum aestivum]|uniref:RanBP2-type domain-containing protein n=2 Tax=Triticum TaxID=4564 RepID=A0A9R0YJ60_TRITD|nr:uncharacterized protein LOC123136491 [Triticum aestivum]VAI55860.1 unnamed protein product [Triticum turgidum subsp. durum]
MATFLFRPPFHGRLRPLRRLLLPQPEPLFLPSRTLRLRSPRLTMASSPPPPSSPSTSTLPPPPEWPCARCTLRNPRSAAACAACDAARPVDVDDASLGQSAVVASSSSRPLPPAQWSCARCTLLNPGSSAACAVCRAARPVAVDDGDDLDFSAVAGASFLPLRRDPRNIGRSDAAMKLARAASPDAVCERAGSNERDKTAAEKGCSRKRGHTATSDIVHEGDGSNKIDETATEKGCSRKIGRVTSPAIVHEGGGSNERDEPTAKKVNSETHLDKKTIKVMTYNVWFREDLELTKRMYALGNLIQHHNPDLICFQEVTPNIYMLLQKSGWWQEYKCSLSARMAMQRQYYCMQMSKLPVSSFECMPFSNSVMERELCMADINIGGATKLVLATSHLESPCAWNQMYSKERVTQANASMRILDKFRNVIFCGDMNWDDKGDGPFPLSDGWVDAWAELKPGEDGWTYDTRANGMLAGNRKLQKRLDRFVCKLPDFEINTIEMIGKEAIPGISHYKEKTVRKVVQNIEYPVLPSDHFGLVLSITYAS